jgi:hypothetical protein
MTNGLPGAGAASSLRPLGVVPDANVFTRQSWVDRLVGEAREGRVRLYWSPKIVEEMARVRLWIWVKRELRGSPPPAGSRAWKLWWGRYSAEAHAWFARVSPLASVVEDREPHEPAWAEPHPDPNDAWLWNAARRIGADFVVTENLKDAPPLSAASARLHDRVNFVHPTTFMSLLDLWDDLWATADIPADVEDWARTALHRIETRDTDVIVAALRMVLARMADEAEG